MEQKRATSASQLRPHPCEFLSRNESVYRSELQPALPEHGKNAELVGAQSGCQYHEDSQTCRPRTQCRRNRTTVGLQPDDGGAKTRGRVIVMDGWDVVGGGNLRHSSGVRLRCAKRPKRNPFGPAAQRPNTRCLSSELSSILAACFMGRGLSVS